MSTKRSKKPAPPPPPSLEPGKRVFQLDKASTGNLLCRLSQATIPLAPAQPGTSQALTTGPDLPAPPVKDQFNAAIGCKTDEVALHLLAQVVALQAADAEHLPDAQVDTLLLRATAMVAELQPTTAHESFLAAQIIATHNLVMGYGARAMQPGQTVDAADRNVKRMAILGRLFLEQTEAMSKLKGKGGQQRVVVEYVTVEAGGQAIVGNVIPGGRG